MKKKLFRFGLPVLLLALGLVAIAGNGHFIANQTDASLSGQNLVVSFKEAGLESGSVETITASADGTATYFCVNNGGRNPSANNKHTVAGPVSASGDFAASKNGNVVGSLTITPPPPTFSCPSGQTLRTGSVTYTNVSLVDSTSGATATFSGTFSTGCLLTNVTFGNGVTCE